MKQKEKILVMRARMDIRTDREELRRTELRKYEEQERGHQKNGTGSAQSPSARN